ncbi:MAG: hypothetical protein LAT64_09610 [Phycisphaerales bacterium]|nr:hypothetical protein [Planctomycetota bacterium]MCH8509004.1 hypothetical protein [Phycisphaerales bacterium]
MKRLKIIAITLATTALLGFAAVRAAPYLKSGSGPQEPPGRAMIVKTLSNISIPVYSDSNLTNKIDEICASVRREVHRSLLELDAHHRPDDSDARMIADAFVRYFRINRTASFEEALASYPVRGVDPGYVLVQEDTQKAKNAWALSTVWARHEVLGPKSISVTPLFRAGSRVSNPASPGMSFETRKLASGGLLSFDAHNYTAYTVVVDAKVPSLDGVREVDVTIGFAIVNDRPGGRWDVAEVCWIKIPADEHLVLPIP